MNTIYFGKTFSSAFFELFIHELFLRQGFEIEIHPKINDSNRKPDFLIKKDGIEVFIEAKEVKVIQMAFSISNEVSPLIPIALNYE